MVILHIIPYIVVKNISAIILRLLINLPDWLNSVGRLVSGKINQFTLSTSTFFFFFFHYFIEF